MTAKIQKSVAPAASSSARGSMTHLLWFFALVYVAEGSGGLLSQPLNYYLKQVHGWTPLQISAYVTILNLPWMIKPLYGLVSDLIPVFGYRRKSYLLLANAAAIAGFLLVTQLNVPNQLVFAFLLTAFATAISSAVSGAVLVENGQRLHRAEPSSINNGFGTPSRPWQLRSSAASSSSALSQPLLCIAPPP